MKQVVKVAGLVAVLMSVVGLSGCNKVNIPRISNKHTFEDMQKAVKKLTDDGVPASVGVAESRREQMALTQAKADARKNLAQQVKIKIENLEKNFAEEIGESSGSEINELFSTATKNITAQEISGSVPKVQKFKTSDDGTTKAYVLMVLDPNIIGQALAQQASSNQALYERFRASKAFEELDREMKEYAKSERKALAGFE